MSPLRCQLSGTKRSRSSSPQKASGSPKRPGLMCGQVQLASADGAATQAASTLMLFGQEDTLQTACSASTAVCSEVDNDAKTQSAQARATFPAGPRPLSRTSPSRNLAALSASLPPLPPQARAAPPPSPRPRPQLSLPCEEDSDGLQSSSRFNARMPLQKVWDATTSGSTCQLSASSKSPTHLKCRELREEGSGESPTASPTAPAGVCTPPSAPALAPLTPEAAPGASLPNPFLTLAYRQAQADYLQAQFPVLKEDATTLCVLQLLADFGPGLANRPTLLDTAMEGLLPQRVLGMQPMKQWRAAVEVRYKALSHLSKQEARAAFQKLLNWYWGTRSLPYGNSALFSVHRLEDPTGLLPPEAVLGINARGIHFFSPGASASIGTSAGVAGYEARHHLFSAALQDVLDMSCSSQVPVVQLRAQAPGCMHTFHFGSGHGYEMRAALHAAQAWQQACSKAAAHEAQLSGCPSSPKAVSQQVSLGLSTLSL